MAETGFPSHLHDLAALTKQGQQALFTFLLTDIDVAFTFLDLAASVSEPRSTRRISRKSLYDADRSSKVLPATF